MLILEFIPAIQVLPILGLVVTRTASDWDTSTFLVRISVSSMRKLVGQAIFIGAVQNKYRKLLETYVLQRINIKYATHQMKQFTGIRNVQAGIFIYSGQVWTFFCTRCVTRNVTPGRTEWNRTYATQQ